MSHLDRLEAQSVYILREAFNRIEKLAMLWSLGKDFERHGVAGARRRSSATCRSRSCISTPTRSSRRCTRSATATCAEWKLEPDRRRLPAGRGDRPDAAAGRALGGAQDRRPAQRASTRYGFNGIIAGIRRDEEATRAKERVFSPRGESGQWDFRDQPPEFWDHFNTDLPPGTHLRVHPLLHWTEIDIWRYIAREQIPIVELYFARNGKRYRSLGDQDITSPIDSNASTIDEIIAELETDQARRSAPAAPWITRPRTRSSACAPPAICDAAAPP